MKALNNVVNFVEDNPILLFFGAILAAVLWIVWLIVCLIVSVVTYPFPRLYWKSQDTFSPFGKTGAGPYDIWLERQIDDLVWAPKPVTLFRRARIVQLKKALKKELDAKASR